MGRWEELEHTADLSIRVWGESLADLFVTAAEGLTGLLAEAPGEVPLTTTETLHLNAMDVESLLVDWLNELLFLSEGETLRVFVAFEIEALSETALTARVRGGPVARFANYIKAATFHRLAVRQTETGYETTLVFDI